MATSFDVTFDRHMFDESVADLVVMAFSTSDHAKKAGAEFLALHAPQYIDAAVADELLSLREQCRKLETDLALRKKLAAVPPQGRAHQDKAHSRRPNIVSIQS